MGKKLLILLITGGLLTYGLIITGADNQVFSGNLLNIHIVLRIGNTQALINDEPYRLEPPPLIINNRVMVPLRFVAETLNAQVQWDGSENKVTVKSLNREIELWRGRNFALINGKQFSLDSPPILIKGRVLVPVRLLAEALGATVNWKPQSREVEIIKLLSGEVVLAGQIVGIDLFQREFLLLWGNRTLTMVGVDTALVEGRALILEDFSLRMPVVIWGTLEENQVRLQRVLTGTNTPPPVQAQLLKGIIKAVNLTDSRLLVVVDDGRTLPITIHPDTELILDGKKAVLADFKRGFRVSILAHVEPGRILTLQVKGEKTPLTVSGTITSVRLRELSLLSGGQTIKITIDSKTVLLVEGKKVGQGWLVAFRRTVINQKAQITGFYENGSLLALKIEISN